MSLMNDDDIDALFEKIARDKLFVPTLLTRKSDSLDFHEVAVWQLRAALEAAFEAGKRASGRAKRRAQVA